LAKLRKSTTSATIGDGRQQGDRAHGLTRRDAGAIAQFGSTSSTG
jgi:hypothetical protein